MSKCVTLGVGVITKSGEDVMDNFAMIICAEIVVMLVWATCNLQVGGVVYHYVVEDTPDKEERCYHF